jgi:hypothetical protein
VRGGSVADLGIVSETGEVNRANAIALVSQLICRLLVCRMRSRDVTVGPSAALFYPSGIENHQSRNEPKWVAMTQEDQYRRLEIAQNALHAENDVFWTRFSGFATLQAGLLVITTAETLRGFPPYFSPFLAWSWPLCGEK